VLAALVAALGTLAKGPVALVLPGLAAAGLRLARRELRSLHVVPVLGAAAALAGLWYAVAFAREGWAFVDVVARENLLRFLDTEAAETGHAHGAPYLFVLGLVGLLPWTPIASLALAAPRTPATALAAAWTVTGIVFLALAASKRSVYLLPLYPALALLVAGGMAATDGAGPARRLARLGARTYPIAFALIAAVAAAGALGLDVAAPIRPLLKPQDAAGAVALVTAAREARAALMLLAIGTAGAAFAAGRAVRADAWPRLVLVVAAAFVAWTAFFNGVLHPAIGRSRSVREFLAHVGTIVPMDTSLHTRFPPDPALRFYAPRTLVPWPDERLPGGYVLLWENEWRTTRDARGASLDVIAVSDSSRPRNGHLALARIPEGPIRTVPEHAAGRTEPGFRNLDTD
jgi:4-amino-4-deoxy-L-arabinose transferase-like glycosyltransferase